MTDYICLLVTLFYLRAETLMECAVKVKIDKIPECCLEYFREQESKEFFKSILPEHVKSLGPIVDVKEIFEVIIDND